MAKLSPTMIEARDAMAAADGAITRHPGGFWATSQATRQYDGIPYPYWGTPTVEALVSRGVATYSVWKERRNGSKFPVEARLTNPPPQPEERPVE